MSVPTRVRLSGREPLASTLADELRRRPDIELAVGVAAADVVLHVVEDGPLRADELRALVGAAQAPLVLVAERADPSLLEEALEADVADVLVLPQPAERIAFAARRAARTAARRAEEDGRRRARVITVFSPKGGTGKTLVSSNLAAHLSKTSGLRTLLVDLDVQFGDAAIMLGLEPEKTLHDLASAPGELDADKLRGYLTPDPKTGIDVLAAPLRPEEGELVTEEKIDAVLEIARHAYDAIVVDTSPSFHGPMLSALDHSDELLLICNPEVPTLKNVRLGTETLRRIAFPEERIRLVLNRADPEAGIRVAEVESVLGLPVRYELPRTREVPESVNRGSPLVLMFPFLAFSTAMAAMSNSLANGNGKATNGKVPAKRFARSWRGRRVRAAKEPA